LIGLGFKGFTVYAHKDQTINMLGEVGGGGKQKQQKWEERRRGGSRGRMTSLEGSEKQKQEKDLVEKS